MMNQAAVNSRTMTCWKLAFVHAGKLIHFLCSALLLSLASAAMGFAWLCCWLDRFKSSRQSTSWLIRARLDGERRSTRNNVVAPEGFSSRAERLAPAARTIDGMIGSKGIRAH